MSITLKEYGVSSFLMYILLYRCVLDFSYSKIISNFYSYQGFQNNFSLVSEFYSLFILLIFSFFVSKIYRNRDKTISNEILLVLFLMSFVPFTSMLGFGVLQINFVIANIVFWVCLILFSTVPLKYKQIKSSIRITLKVGKRELLSETRIKALTVLFGMVVLYVSGIYTGFRLNFSLANVYELRESARDFHLPVLVSYAFSWTRTVNSIFIAYYMQKKDWGWAILCFGIQLLNFGIDGSKSTLFLAVFAVVINLVPKFSLQRLNKWIVLGFCGTVFICTMFYIIFSDSLLNSLTPASLFIRRALYLPVYISTNYFDFFTTYSPDYFRQSILRFAGFVSPYEDISYMIGERYFGRVTAANNGLISDAVTNMGLAGVILAPCLYALVLRTLNNVSEGLDARIHLAAVMYIAAELVNTFLFRVLLTHGLIITTFILYMMTRDMVKNTNTVLIDKD